MTSIATNIMTTTSIRANSWQCLAIALGCALPGGCRAANGVPPVPTATQMDAAAEPAEPKSTAMPPSHRGELLATVDGIELREQVVDAWSLGRASGHGRDTADRTPESRATAINAIIFAHLLKDACGAVCKSGPPTEERCACGDDWGARHTVAKALGMYTPTDADVLAEYERQKPHWTSDSPWVALSVVAVPWLEPVGLPACDRLAAQEWRCGRDGVAALVGDRAGMKRSAAASPERRREIAETCSALRKRRAKEARSPRSCDWSSSAPIGKASQQIARERLIDARAALLALRVTPPDARREPPRTSVSRDPWLAAGRSIVSMDRIPSALRKVVEQATPGQPSEPIEGDGTYWIVRVDERWPAGPLPLDARRDEFTEDARVRLAERAMDELPVRIREGHEIVMHRYETEARALLAPRNNDAAAEARRRNRARADAATRLFELLDAE
jgi:hypothetical protein